MEIVDKVAIWVKEIFYSLHSQERLEEIICEAHDEITKLDCDDIRAYAQLREKLRNIYKKEGLMSDAEIKIQVEKDVEEVHKEVDRST